MSKTERVCQFYKLAIVKNGDVFPCCLHRENSKLGNIFDENIFEQIETKNICCECGLFKTRQILPEDKMDIQKLQLMFSNECQARCVCCFQEHNDKIENEEKHLEKVLEFIEKYKPKYITVLGGEVLIQPKTLDWIEEVKNNHPDISFDIITNLCVGENTIKRAEKIFDDMTISVLGFTPNTYRNAMGLDFNVTMRNFNYLQENTNIKLRPKYLTMPTNIYELSLFLEWALNQKVEKIYLHNIFEFLRCCNIEDSYWNKILIRIEEDIKKIILNKKDFIISKNRHFISFHSPLAGMLNIDNNFIETNGFKDIIKIT